MTYANEDIAWTKSYKGNWWCRKKGILLVVGKHKSTDTYWVRRGESFLPGRFVNEEAAKSAAEHGSASKLDLNEFWSEE